MTLVIDQDQARQMVVRQERVRSAPDAQDSCPSRQADKVNRFGDRKVFADQATDQAIQAGQLAVGTVRPRAKG